jgi:hypothetical protein
MSGAYAKTDDWVRHARRLTGESDAVRQSALRELKRTANLSDQLRAALKDSRRFLALDAVVALRRRELWSDLVAVAPSDDSGFTYHALNSLSEEKDHPELRKITYRRALEVEAPLAARLAALDSLARLRVLLSSSDVAQLKSEDSPEVRQALLSYARAMAVHLGNRDYLQVAQSLSFAKEMQVRMQALSLLEEFPEIRPGQWTRFWLSMRARLSSAFVRRGSAEPYDLRHGRQSPQCRRAYQSILSDGLIEATVVFGYKDARPARFVGDRYERAWFVQRILKKCEAGQTLCGFERSAADSDTFFRAGQHSGVGSQGGMPFRIILRVASSAVGPDDQENRSHPFQKWQSRYAEELFIQAIQKADIVFYNGHSRAGGGPDFEPPQLDSWSHADYGAYQKNPRGLKRMLQALSSMNPGSEKPGSEKLGAKVLGLFSCISSGLFAKQVQGAKKDLGLIVSSKLLYFSDALESSSEALESLLKAKCQPEFRRALERSRVQAGARLIGFLD